MIISYADTPLLSSIFRFNFRIRMENGPGPTTFKTSNYQRPNSQKLKKKKKQFQVIDKKF